MNTETTSVALTAKRCVPCEGGVPKLDRAQAEALRAQTPNWTLSEDGRKIRREWVVRNFMAGMDFLNKVAALAEEEGHHPDLHLVGYRHLAIEIWTHAIDGLSENDFILAAKIDALPIETRKSA
ncbi:pterin-4-alpha-carbinolamine dehydratase [Isosphaera pallida ATCC 43644]|uniref:4a-hydroxytetrahydrobiopterin dehydratase n=1 Tax=Isosphaera pallida (strain ATCC 43644 / DSM 9630 / IS1B) TaxID=575540 RepID=E8R4X5_ISOPI|nr:4a-hydroxytetrahydrobiopterin dehydratase [Isosphaera pallida]ADV61721.1 pterin-4-alpha-carbinolamine dehydratase [Isosphaera pallida ATCC 43644]